jgi:hypothetical protein
MVVTCGYQTENTNLALLPLVAERKTMARPKKLHARITEVGCMMAHVDGGVISPSALRLTPNFCSAQFAGSLRSGVPLDQVVLLLGHSTKITEKQVEPVPWPPHLLPSQCHFTLRPTRDGSTHAWAYCLCCSASRHSVRRSCIPKDG